MGLSIPQERVGDNILNRVQRDMHVYDASGEKIGSVRRVYLGATTEAERETGRGAATLAPADGNPRRETFLDAVAEAFDPSDMPQELAEKLQYSGYIRLDTSGLLAADRFILPEQIARVDGQEIHLNVAYDELIARS